MAVRKGFQKGDRTTVVTPQLGVVKSSKSNLGDIIEGIGEIGQKLSLQKIETLDEQWKTQFKVDADKFLFDSTNKQLDSKDPDLQEMKTEILSYKDTLLVNSPGRYKDYIDQYIAQKSLAKFNTVKNHADKIMIKNQYDNINTDKARIIADIQSQYASIDLAVDPQNLEQISLDTDLITLGITNDISDFNQSLNVLASLDPYNFGDTEIKEQLDSLFLAVEQGRYSAIKSSIYKNIDFNRGDVLEQIQEADRIANELDVAYSKGELFRAATTLTDDDIANIINNSNTQTDQIKGLYQAQIDVANQNLKYEQASQINLLKNTINVSNVNNIKSLLLTGEVQFEQLIKNYNLEEDADLINTLQQKYTILKLLQEEDIDINKASLYDKLFRENNITLFEDEEELRDFLTDYKVAEMEISSDTFNPIVFLEEYKLPADQRSAQTNDMLNMILNENIVPRFLYDYLDESNSIITNPDIDVGSEEAKTIIRSVQLLEFLRQENPLALSSFNEKIDMSFYNYVLDNYGTAFLDAASVGGAIKFYQNNKEAIDKDPNFYKEEIEKFIIDNDTIEESYTNILVEHVLQNTSENAMWADLWNSMQGEQGFKTGTSSPIDNFIEFKTGLLVTDKNPNIIEKGAVGLMNNTAAIIDNIIPGQPLTSTNAKIFFQFAPEAKDFLNNIIYTKLSNSMDIGLFKTNPEKANEIAAGLVPDILEYALKNMYQKNYSISELSSDLGQPTLMKHGIETTMTKNGYTGKDAGYYLATQVKIALTDMQNSEKLKGDKQWFMDNLGFLYAPNGEYKEPTVRDIYEVLEDFQFKPIGGGNTPEYLIFIKNPNATFHGMPLQSDEESYTFDVEPVTFNIDPDSPKTFSDVKYLRHSTILQDKNSFINKALPFLPRHMKRELMEIFELGRPITDTLLEPFAEFVTLGHYDWENLRQEYDKYIDTQLITDPEEPPEVALQ
jgi:hypothetical protein